MFDDFYGLTGRPFQLTPDPAFYFESLTHRKALSYLSYGLAQGEGFVVITGEVGAGKSTLVAHLMATIDRMRLTAAQVATGRLDGEDMVMATAQAFGLRGAQSGYGDRAQVMGEIEQFLQEEARAGRRCLLVVDEVQNLSVEALEELRLLSNFQLGNHPLVQILLLGQPEFRDRLQEHPGLEQLRQRVIASHHLDALEPGEIEPYILHRLRLVGWNGNPSFDQRVFAEMFTATAGVPRRINQIANRLLILGAVEHRRRIDGVMLAQVLAELTADGALPIARGAHEAFYHAPRVTQHAWQAPQPQHQPDFAHAGHDPHHDGDFDLHAALAERDAQIAELQQAVIELANGHDMIAPPLPGAAQDAALTAHDDALDAHGEKLNAHGGAIDAHRASLAALAARLTALESSERPAAPVGDAEREVHSAEVPAETLAHTRRIAVLEGRIDELEHMLRHTLTMLIEWIEREEDLRAAA